MNHRIRMARKRLMVARERRRSSVETCDRVWFTAVEIPNWYAAYQRANYRLAKTSRILRAIERRKDWKV